VRPRFVRVSGPSTWVARQETLHTEPVSIAGRRDTLELVQALVAPPTWATGDARARSWSRSRSTPRHRRELSLPLEVRGIRGELRAELRPAAVRATWRGPRSLLGTVDARSLRARVDADRRGRGLWTLPVEVTGPGASRLTLEPDSVRVVLH
jgi:hypothetical protein